MARLELAPGVLDDLDRFVQHLREHEVEAVDARLKALVDALEVLQHSPDIGRPSRGGKRELVIGPKGRGYVALYRYVEAIDVVLVLAIRNQREVRFKRRRPH